MSTDKLSIDWYNQNSDFYTKHVRDPEDSIYHSLYEKPAMYKLLPDLTGMTVISLGCGSGEDCDHLKKIGANKVTGIDISEAMIKIAKNSYPDCSFQLMDMEKLDFPDNHFDFAYSSLAIHYVEDWTKVFSEVYRVLKSSSFFLFSCNHPVSSSMEVTRDDEDFSIKELSRTKNRKKDSVEIVGNYMGRTSHIQRSFEVTTWYKSFGEMFNELSQANFVIRDLVEPLPLSKMKQVSPTNYLTLQKIPSFLIMKLQKISH
jgi:ubiquinone/menaquinone biosynthesis C-methylase UbiE